MTNMDTRKVRLTRPMAWIAAAAMVASLTAQDATFSVDTKLVVVNVTVKDKAGRLVTNLKKRTIFRFSRMTFRRKLRCSSARI